MNLNKHYWYLEGLPSDPFVLLTGRTSSNNTKIIGYWHLGLCRYRSVSVVYIPLPSLKYPCSVCWISHLSVLVKVPLLIESSIAVQPHPLSGRVLRSDLNLLAIWYGKSIIQVHWYFPVSLHSKWISSIAMLKFRRVTRPAHPARALRRWIQQNLLKPPASVGKPWIQWVADDGLNMAQHVSIIQVVFLGGNSCSHGFSINTLDVLQSCSKFGWLIASLSHPKWAIVHGQTH